MQTNCDKLSFQVEQTVAQRVGMIVPREKSEQLFSTRSCGAKGGGWEYNL